MSTPLISVVVCVYNAGSYLRDSLQSVLDQTHTNLEILLIDDGSTDACVDGISDLIDADNRIRLIRQKNSGKPAAMNRALDEMRGEFYMIHDADDLSHPRRAERQLNCFMEHPEVAAVYCGNELLMGNRCVAPLLQERDVDYCRRCVDIFRMPAHDPTGMYRWSMVKDMRYSPELLLSEGHDYMLRVGERLPMMVIGECLYSYRIHPTSLTKRHPEERNRLMFEVLRRACVRRGLDPETTLGTYEHRTASTNRDLDNNIAAHFIQSALDLRAAGDRWKAIGVGVECARLHLLDPHYYKAMIYALAPAPTIRYIRERRAR
jgi:glycosyltransferase involved in cell wall biosynthesis